MIIIKVFVLIAFFTLCNSKTSFMPNLPLVPKYYNNIYIFTIYYYILFFSKFLMKYVCLLIFLQGEYRMIFEKIYHCESKRLIQINLYLSKKTLSVSELKGNITYLVPFDDTLTVSIYLIQLIIYYLNI